MWKGRNNKVDEMYSIQPVKTYPREETIKRPKQNESQAYMGRRASLRLFFEQNKEIVRNACIILALLLVTNFCTFMSTKRNTTAEMQKILENKIAETAFVTRQETISRMKEEYGINDEKLKQDRMETDSDWNAIMLQAYADAGNTDEGLYLIGCSAKNRQLSNRYPNDMYSVVSAKDQYIGFDESRVPTARVKAIAKDIEKIYDTVGAPMSTSYVYVNWTPREVKLLDNLEKNQPTHTFYESDMQDFLKEWNKTQENT